MCFINTGNSLIWIQSGSIEILIGYQSLNNGTNLTHFQFTGLLSVDFRNSFVVFVALKGISKWWIKSDQAIWVFSNSLLEDPLNKDSSFSNDLLSGRFFLYIQNIVHLKSCTAEIHSHECWKSDDPESTSCVHSYFYWVLGLIYYK